MKKVLGLAALVLALSTTMAFDAQAKRLGGAKSSGMQRQQTTQPATPANTPGSPAQALPAAGAGAAAAAPAAAAAKRSWMGPIAGLAAGLGLMALASHLGFGAAMANVMLMVLLGVVVMAVVGFVMRKRMANGAAPAIAGGSGAAGPAAGSFGGSLTGQPSSGTRIGSALGAVTASAVPSAIPADFDTAAFARNATQQFMALQSANDAGDLQRLRDYLTPDLFEEVRAEIEARGAVAQETQVFGLDAQVLEVVEEGDRYIVSVRFRGSVRDQVHADTEDLDEVWHLTKPRSGFGGWVVAGIQQVSSAT
ncbi:Tim44 domain-containing protein [Caenimonas sp. SL110]|uniref:Tim44 domain-containing protein n=1 Tax=Caenimonas sp. SL110 TaxID=1450524 RepID=UPI000654B0B7|nr:TIM44-like domain-containing protein [Caenimonas sp. SL110]